MSALEVGAVRLELEAGGYGGLYCTEDPCGCKISDLAPCGMALTGDDGVFKAICWPGYRFACIGPECARPCDIGSGKHYEGAWCIWKSKDGPERRVPEDEAEAEAEKARLCPNCGARVEQCGKAQLCPVCGGSGWHDWGIGHDGTAVTTSNCKPCHGCGGKGWVTV